MGKLRERMVQEMRVRDFSLRTIEAYVAAVVGVTRHYGRAPDTLTDEEIHQYLIHLREQRKLFASSCQQIRCGLRFFYDVTVRRPRASLSVPGARQPQKLPEILSRQEVTRIIESTRTLRYRLLLMVTYGGGLRLSEVIHLRPSDLDRDRRLMRVEQGKGKKDRYTLLPARVIHELDHYVAVYGRPGPWVFGSVKAPEQPLDPSTPQKVYYAAKLRAGIEKRGGIHALRHAFATPLLEAGTDLPTIRNRHCPKCQGAQRAKWLAAEQAVLLPVPYFHVVFTLPHALNPLIRVNARRLYALLFHAAAATLQQFARDPRHRGAELGILMVLHTWGPTLTEHVHVHCVVTGGGLSADHQRWIPTRRRDFLFPVSALSRLFRGKYLARLARAYARGQLRCAGQSAPLAAPQAWQTLLATLRHTAWVVYAKPPFADAARVLKYLSRYTHRVAISNHRLRFVGDGLVRFAYTAYADHGRHQEMTLSGEEFLRRFLLHVVPRGFMRIRHYGIVANRQRQRKLARSRELLHPPPAPAPASVAPRSVSDVGHGASRHALSARCPNCGARMQHLDILPPQRCDTS